MKASGFVALVLAVSGLAAVHLAVAQQMPANCSDSVSSGRWDTCSGQPSNILGDRSRQIGELGDGTMHGTGRIINPDGIASATTVKTGDLVQTPAGPEGAPALLLATGASPVPVGLIAQAPVPRDGALARGASRQEPGFATGRVTMADGSPLPPSVQEVELWLSGVTVAGQHVNHAPEVRPDGTFRQRLAPGDYRFSSSPYTGVSGQIAFRHQGRTFRMPLEPVGNDAFRSRDAAIGFVQNFVWKPQGVTPAGLLNGPSPTSATHWYGMEIRTQPGGWWADFQAQGAFTLGRAPNQIPAGTTVTMTLRPLTPAVDGRTIPEITIMRDIDRMSPHEGPTYRQITTTFYDLPPADYELTGFATLPNGRQHTLLFQGTEADRLGYLRDARINLEPGGASWGFGYRTLVFYLDGQPPGTVGLPAAPQPVPGGEQTKAPQPQLGVGATVEILWNGVWYPGTIKATRGQGRWLVGYEGYDASWDEVVGPDRIRPWR